MIKRLMAAAALACALPLATPAAATPAAQQLPEPGPVELLTVVDDMTIACGGEEFTIDLSGTTGIEVGAPLGLVIDLTTTELRLEGSGPDFGAVTITGNAPADGRLTLNSLVDPYPAVMDVGLSFRLEAEQNPCAPPATTDARAAQGLILDTAGPGTLSTINLQGFPPQGDLFQLGQTIPLIPLVAPTALQDYSAASMPTTFAVL